VVSSNERDAEKNLAVFLITLFSHSSGYMRKFYSNALIKSYIY